MRRILVLAVIVASLIVLCGKQSAKAEMLSPRNPYRSFNISGVNYGSMQWEKQHRQTNHSYNRNSGRVYRRR